MASGMRHELDPKMEAPQTPESDGFSVGSSTKKGKKFACNFCEQFYSSAREYNAHVIGHIGQDTFSCNMCNSTFSSHVELLDHKRKNHAQTEALSSAAKVHTCSHCDLKFGKKTQLKEHMAKTHGFVKEYPCKICGTKFTDLLVLKRHKRTHTNPNKLLLRIKNINNNEVEPNIVMSTSSVTTNGSSDGLKKKIKIRGLAGVNDTDTVDTINSSEKYDDKDSALSLGNEDSCSIDTMSSASSTDIFESTNEMNSPVFAVKSVVSHVPEVDLTAKETEDGEEIYSCSVCFMGFGSLGSLKYHLRDHGTGPTREFKCKLCPADFRTLKQLNGHRMLAHSKHLGFSCEYCNKELAHKGALARHKISCEEKLTNVIICRLCKAEFSSRKELYKHGAVHEIEKKFICLKCGKKFHRSDYLKKHLVTHSMNRPFHCELCPQRFNTKHGVSSHMLKAHKQPDVDETEEDKSASGD